MGPRELARLLRWRPMFRKVLPKRCVDGLRIAEYLRNVGREQDYVCSLHIAFVVLPPNAAWRGRLLANFVVVAIYPDS